MAAGDREIVDFTGALTNIAGSVPLAALLPLIAGGVSLVIDGKKILCSDVTSVFAANGIHVHLWPQLSPVPTVSFATRYLHASQGVMITASHNPSKYNITDIRCMALMVARSPQKLRQK